MPAGLTSYDYTLASAHLDISQLQLTFLDGEEQPLLWSTIVSVALLPP